MKSIKHEMRLVRPLINNKEKNILKMKKYSKKTNNKKSLRKR